MKQRYHLNLFWSNTDACWVADVPDLTPCSAFGDTSAAALAEIEDAISGWLASAAANGHPIPDARYRPAIYSLSAAG